MFRTTENNSLCQALIEFVIIVYYFMVSVVKFDISKRNLFKFNGFLCQEKMTHCTARLLFPFLMIHIFLSLQQIQAFSKLSASIINDIGIYQLNVTRETKHNSFVLYDLLNDKTDHLKLFI